ncbi:MAG: MOSC domain-containing protein [Crocinitomicaceae bacterium]|nr:MOSC domain-containing protein [Crocinitomicaceae bacterium]
MKVVSTNISDVRTVNWRGKRVQTGIFKEPVNGPIFLGDTDVKDDHVVDRKYHGGKDKACYIYSADCYSFWKNKYPQLEFSYGMFGENITVEGLNDALLHIGDIYQLGESRIQIAQPRQPCFKLGIKFGTQKVLKEFIQAPYPGAYVRVLDSGSVKTGDTLKLISKHPSEINLLEVYRLIYHSDQSDVNKITKLIQEEVLPNEMKEGLKKRLNS